MNERAEIQEFVDGLQAMMIDFSQPFDPDAAPPALLDVLETFRARQLTLFQDLIQASQAVLESLPA